MPSSEVETQAPSTREPSAYRTSPVACTVIGVGVGVTEGLGVGVAGLGVGVAGFGVGVAGFGVGVRTTGGRGVAVGSDVGDSVAAAGASEVGLGEGSVIAVLAEGSGDSFGWGEI